MSMTGMKHSAETKAKMSRAKAGRNNPRWNGGVSRIGGYVYLRIPGHPFANKKGLVPEHRVVIEHHLGRFLRPEEVVHHLNKATDDNRIANLMLFRNKAEHMAFEHRMARLLGGWKRSDRCRSTT